MIDTIYDYQNQLIDLSSYGITNTKKSEFKMPQFTARTYKAFAGLYTEYASTDQDDGTLQIQMLMSCSSKLLLMQKRSDLVERMKHCFITFKKESGLTYECVQNSGTEVVVLSETSCALLMNFSYTLTGGIKTIDLTSWDNSTDFSKVLSITGAKDTPLYCTLKTLSSPPSGLQIDFSEFFSGNSMGASRIIDLTENFFYDSSYLTFYGFIYTHGSKTIYVHTYDGSSGTEYKISDCFEYFKIYYVERW